MPVMEIKTNIKVDSEKRSRITKGLVASVAACEEYVSHNILFTFKDEEWIEFRENTEEPALLGVFHPGPMTPVEDYKPIVDGFFKVFSEELPEIDKSRIYVTVSEIRYWGWNGGLL